MTNLDGLLDRLEDAQLVRQLVESEPAYIFKHALTQETAYESILTKRRRKLHRAVAEAYEQLYPDRLDEHAALLARHYAEAGDDAKALEYATRAGDTAARVYANEEAGQCYTQALDLVQRGTATSAATPDGTPLLIHLYLKRGRALELSGRDDAAMATYREMEAEAARRGDRAMELAALTARATLQSAIGSQLDPAAAQTVSERALRLARELGDRAAEAKTLWNMMLLYMFGGLGYEQAMVYGEQSLAIARELNLREQIAFTLNDLAKAYLPNARPAEAQTAFEESRQLWREMGNLPMLADSLATGGRSAFFRGDYGAAVALWAESFQLCQTINNLIGQVTSRMYFGYVQMDLGHPDEAIQTLEAVYPMGLEAGHHGGAAMTGGHLAWVYAMLGAQSRALDLARQVEHFAAVHVLWGRSWAQAMLARVHLLGGDVAQATRVLGEHYGGFDPTGALPSIPAEVGLAHGEVALANQDYGRALAVMDELIAALHQLEIRPYAIDALRVRGRALLATGQVEPAMVALGEARAEAEAVGSRRGLWPVLVALGEIEDLRGNHAAAQRLSAEAGRIVTDIADHTGSQELRTSFLRRPDVQAVLQNGRLSP